MFTLATAAQMRELDRRAIQERGVPSLELMEHAAAAVADAVWELLHPEGDGYGPTVPGGSHSVVFFSKKGDQPPTDEEQAQMDEIRSIVESKNTDPIPRIAVFCGPGNNGGDGFAAARLLRERGGCQVRAFFVGDRSKMSPDERVMAEKWAAAGGELEDFTVDMASRETLEATLDFQQQKLLAWLTTCDCAVDALFGVGLNRPLEGALLTAVRLLDGKQRCPVVACDIPSGVNADTGEVLGEAVRAKVTVTFTCPKPGLYLGEGASRAGEVRVVDIGIPHELEYETVDRAPQRAETVGWEECRLPRRPRTAHKGDFGKLFILAGSAGYTGAAFLAAEAALRTGAGLVYLGVPEDIYPILAVKCIETMPFPLPGSYEALLKKIRGCDAALIGPGLGRAKPARKLVRRLLADLEFPVVLDADGINAISGHIDILDKRRFPTVLTPHEGEFSRLTGCEVPVRDRLAAAREFAAAHRCTLVLKGPGTVTAAPSGRAWINTTGNPGMAKGGSGDVLAGMLAALWVQKHLNGRRPDLSQSAPDLSELAARAVCLHGRAGNLCAQKLGEYAMTPSDLIAFLPRVLREAEEHS